MGWGLMRCRQELAALKADKDELHRVYLAAEDEAKENALEVQTLRAKVLWWWWCGGGNGVMW